jgi:hypothetical protein
METKSGTYSFIFLLSIYLLLHAAQVWGLGPEWIRFYGKDIILVPLLLLGVTRVQSIVNRKVDIRYKEIIILVIYVSIVFEVIIPLIRTNITSDIWDVVMYIAGAALYQVLAGYKSEQIRFKKTVM